MLRNRPTVFLLANEYFKINRGTLVNFDLTIVYFENTIRYSTPHSTTSIELTDTTLYHMYRIQSMYVSDVKSWNITKSQSDLESYARSLPPLRRFSTELIDGFWGIDEDDIFGTGPFDSKIRSQFLERLLKVKEKFTFRMIYTASKREHAIAKRVPSFIKKFTIINTIKLMETI